MSLNELLKRIENQEKDAKAFGFYWEHINQLTQQIRSECAEIDEAWEKNNASHLQEEIGDLLQASLSLCIFSEVDVQETLLKSIEKFQRRYEKLVSLVKEDGHDHLKMQSSDVLLSYWKKAKQVQ